MVLVFVLLKVLVAVMVVVPGLWAVTLPVMGFMDATVGLLEDQLTDVDALPVTVT
jgi:hypothetical protein